MKNNELHHAPFAFSRRGFFALVGAVAASSSLPFWEGVYLRAYADENGTTSYKIYVAKRWEVPVAFLDMTDPSNPGSVSGAHISITSLDTSKTVEAVTDDLGVALVDARTLVTNERQALTPADYSFYGAITVHADRYRSFEAGIMGMQGGVNVEAPTQRLDDRPYLTSLTAEGWDIQYAKETTFTATTVNRGPHTVTARIASSSHTRAQVALYQNSGFRMEQDVTFADGMAQAEFQGALFSQHEDDARQALALDETVYLSVDFPGDTASSFVVTTCLRTQEGAVEKASQKEGVYTLETMTPVPGTIAPVSLPPEFPFLGGEKLKVEKLFPAFPLTFNCNPAGFIVIGTGVPVTFDALTKDWSKKTVQDVKRSYQSIGNEWTTFFNEVKERRANPANADNCRKRILGKQPLSKSLVLDFEGGALVALQWLLNNENGLKESQGTMYLYGSVMAKAAVTQQVNVAFVPIFVMLEGALSTGITAEFPVWYSKEQDKLQMGKDAATEILTKLRIALSLGIGLADVLSVALRGAGQISLTARLAEKASEEGKPSNRITVGAGADVAIVVQAALFKASYQLWNISEPELYDSWKDAKSLNATAPQAADRSAFFVRLPDGGTGYSATVQGGALNAGSDVASTLFTAHAVPVTTAELAGTAEFTASPRVSRSGASGRFAYTPIPRKGLKARAGEFGAVQALTSAGPLMLGGVVHEDVFSDPRMNVVSVSGVPWLFRILTVNYPDNQTRTRLSVAKWETDHWGPTSVLDFTPQVMLPQDSQRVVPERLDQFDYDFSVVSADATLGTGKTWTDGSAVRVFLTSGTRPNGADTTIGQAMAHTLGTFITLNPDGNVIQALCYPDTYQANPVSSTDANSPCMFANPRIMAAKDSNGDSITVVFAFCRRANSQDALVGGPYEEYPATAFFASDGTPLGSKFGFVYANIGSMRPMGSGGETPQDFLTQVKHSVCVTPYQMNVSGSHFASICVHYVTDGPDGRVAKSFLVLRYVSQLDEPGEVVLMGVSGPAQFVHPWLPAGTGGALCSTPDGMVTKSLEGSPVSVTSTNVSLTSGVSLESFALDEDACMLYYATVFDDVDEQGTEVKDYRIWASRYVDFNGQRVFLDPFPLLQTESPIDSFQFADLGNAYGFAVNSIVSMQDSVSRVMFYSVPYIKHVSLEGFGSVNPTVCAGETERFNVTLHNMGNVLVSAVTLRITVGGVEQEITLDLTSADVTPYPVLGDAIQVEGTLNPETAEPLFGEASMDAISQSGILIPGKTRVYQFTWKVPEDLHGTVDLQVSVAADDSLQVAPAENDRMQSAQHAEGMGIEGPVVDGTMTVVTAGTMEDGEPSVTKSAYRYGNDPEPEPTPGEDEQPGSQDGPGGQGGTDEQGKPGDQTGPGGEIKPDGHAGAGRQTRPDSQGGANSGSQKNSSYAPTADSLSSTAAAALLAALGVAGATAVTAKRKISDTPEPPSTSEIPPDE